MMKVSSDMSTAAMTDIYPEFEAHVLEDGHRFFVGRLPEDLCPDAAGFEDVTFHTKPQIAAALIRDVAVLGQVELDWVVGDSEYGRAGHGHPVADARS
jgi:hypothetical protein